LYLSYGQDDLLFNYTWPKLVKGYTQSMFCNWSCWM